jgi:hypothetical protein
MIFVDFVVEETNLVSATLYCYVFGKHAVDGRYHFFDVSSNFGVCMIELFKAVGP